MSAIHLQSDDVHSLSHQYKGRLTGQKPPLKPKDVWAIRILLQIHGKTRDLALFNLAIDSKLRSCDLVALRVEPPTAVAIAQIVRIEVLECFHAHTTPSDAERAGAVRR